MFYLNDNVLKSNKIKLRQMGDRKKLVVKNESMLLIRRIERLGSQNNIFQSL